MKNLRVRGKYVYDQTNTVVGYVDESGEIVLFPPHGIDKEGYPVAEKRETFFKDEGDEMK